MTRSPDLPIGGKNPGGRHVPGRSESVHSARVELGIAGLGDVSEAVTNGSIATYRARRANGDDVMVKVVGRADDAFVDRFLGERDVVMALSRSPKIVTIHDAGTTSLGSPYLLLDPTAASLHDHVAELGPIAEPEASLIMAGVAEAIADAHLIGVVHQGVSPATICRDDDGVYRLTDFTLSPVIDRPSGYLAPEARSSRSPRIGAAVDVYSLGATLLFLVTGRSPGEPDALDAVRAAPVRDLIVSAMDFDPARRPSALEIQRRLLELGRRETQPAPPDPSWAPPKLPPRVVRSGQAQRDPVVVDESSETVELAEVLSSSPTAAEEWRAAVAGRSQPPRRPLVPLPALSASKVARPARSEHPRVLRDEAAVPVARFDERHRATSRWTDLVDDVIVRVRSLLGFVVGMLAGAVLLAGAYVMLEERTDGGDGQQATSPSPGPSPAVGSGVVPLVAQLDRDAAAARVENAGFVVEVIWEFHPVLPRGQVIASDPESGSSIELGSSVSLTVSRGTEPTCAGSTETAIRGELEGRGLTVAGVTRSTNEAVDADLVLRCIIYDETETAIIVVSDGPGEADS